MNDKCIRILNIEDEEVDHLALIRAVKEKALPYEIERAASIAEGLKLIGEKEYDVALIDYILPDGTGLDVLGRLKDTVGIFLTGSGDETVAVKAMKGGAYDYVIKEQTGGYLALLPVVIEKALETARLRKDKEEAERKLREKLDAMDEEQRAMMFMLADTNRAVDEMEKAQGKLKEEIEVTSHLLMIAEASANITNIDRLMKEVIHCVQKILDCDICLIYAWDAEAKSFSPVQESGLPREAVPQFRTESLDAGIALIKRVLGGKEPVVTARSVEDMMRVRISDEGVRVEEFALSWLPFGDTIAGISLTSKKNPLGLILAVFRQEKEFTDREFQVMQGMSNQVSVSLEQAKLYRESTDRGMELSHKIATIQAMHEIDRSILSTMDPQEIIEIAVRTVSKVVSCDGSAVLLVDKEKEGFSYAAGFGLPFVSEDVFIPFKETIATEVITTGRPQYIANLKDLAETQYPASLLPLEDGLLREGFLSQIRLPLSMRHEIAGILTIEAKRAAAFTPQDLSTLEKIASQIGVSLQNARQLKDLEDLFLGTVKSLSATIDAKSPWTAGHSERVTKYAVAIGKVIGLSERELKDLELAGLLHDVGKVGTYEAVLDKPDKLTPEELAVMRQHVTKSAEILAPIKQLKEVIPGIKAHHEYYDGTGYPDGLKGEGIPLFGRILTVADTVDAMGADRPYRNGRGMDVIIVELKRCSGTQFDPKVVEAFLKVSEMAEELKTAAS